MKAPLFLGMLLVGMGASSSLAIEPTGTSVPPVSQLVPREEGAGTTLKPLIRAVKWSNMAAAVLTYYANSYRLDLQTTQALKAVLPAAGKLLTDAGAPGVLLEAIYVRNRAAVNAGPEKGPPNLSQRLLGDQVKIVGAGNGPVEVLAISLQQTSKKSSFDIGTDPTQEYVPGATRDYWITKDKDGGLKVADVDNDSLYRSARDIVLNEGLYAQMSAAAYRSALTNMIARAERIAGSQPAKNEAARLLTERKQALKELEVIDSRLREELERAKRANSDADKFALVAGLAGLASSIVQNVEATKTETGTSKDQPKVSQSTSVQRIDMPSGGVMELLRQRLQVEGKVLRSDDQIGAYLVKDGKVVYVPLQ